MDFTIHLTAGLLKLGIFLTAILSGVGGLYLAGKLVRDRTPKSPEEERRARLIDEIRFRQMERGTLDRGAGGDPAGCLWLALGGLFAMLTTGAVMKALQAAPPAATRTIVGLVMILALAGVLFWLKVKLPIFYGSVEILAAAVLAASTMYFELQDDIAAYQALKLLTAAYLFVRGFDNLRTGLKARRETKNAAAVSIGARKA